MANRKPKEPREENPVLVEDTGSRAKRTSVGCNLLEAGGRRIHKANHIVKGFTIAGGSKIDPAGQPWIAQIFEDPEDALAQVILLSRDNMTIQLFPLVANYEDAVPRRHHAHGMTMRHIRLQIGGIPLNIGIPPHSQFEISYGTR